MDRKPSAILIHASAFFAPFIVPIIFILIATERGVKDLAIEGMLFHVIMGIGFTISSFLTATIIGAIIGIPLFIALGIVYIVYPIKGIIRAVNDEEFHYPVVSQWVR
ncbi:MAG TPA: DUF4870 domain-containing protein [Paenibacillaceae bacterium]|nr:DUF4870 domain-containing protein [Paenibacillaceae bacterium]